MTNRPQIPAHYRWCCKCQKEKTTKGGKLFPLFRCAECLK